MNVKRKFASKLINWHKSQNIDFPWRRTNNAFHVLIAELLLKKTTRNQVNKIYNEIISEFSDPELLAEAKLITLQSKIDHLGMQKKRAKTLIKTANYIINEYQGNIPNTPDELMKLPGVGRYTANAVLCLTYNKTLPLVDTNVVRLIERVFLIKSDRARPRDDPKIWEFVNELLPKRKARYFNLAIIDFANKICLARKPKCKICPINYLCKYKNKTDN